MSFFDRILFFLDRILSEKWHNLWKFCHRPVVYWLKRVSVDFFVKNGLWCQLYCLITREKTRKKSYRPAKKRAPTEQYRRRRRRKTKDHAKSAPTAPKKRKKSLFFTFLWKNEIGCHLYRVITRDLLIGRSSFLRQSIALDLSYRSAQKWAPAE